RDGAGFRTQSTLRFPRRHGRYAADEGVPRGMDVRCGDKLTAGHHGHLDDGGRLVIATTCHACLAEHPNQGHDAHRDKATGTTCSAIGPATTVGAVSDPSPRPS